MLVELDHPTRGRYVQVGSPINLSDSPVVHKRAPLLGEHTDEVLKWLGYGDNEIASMHQEGAV
jgi:formyl-CoA transferase